MEKAEEKTTDEIKSRYAAEFKWSMGREMTIGESAAFLLGQQCGIDCAQLIFNRTFGTARAGA